ncbi:hypothetical protein VE02_03297 [Pseudogymnoascus sp. 03VT05]|nr:hypothetical protein VE02_03297 [Pseudogymnoascus sp. 03VT05]
MLKLTRGRTPLSHAATAYGQETALKLLIERDDAEVNSQDNKGLTPLMWAAQVYFEKDIGVFLEHEDVDVNLRDKDGHTALWWAENKKREKIVEMVKLKTSLERDEYDQNV